MNYFRNSEDKKRVINNFLSLVVLRGFQFIIPLITLPYLIRTIGIENFGLLNYAVSLGFFFGAVIQFGFSVTATREIARYRDDHVNLEKIYSNTISVSIILSVVSVFIFALIVFAVENFYKYLSVYFFTIVFIVFQSLFPIWFFQGLEKMKYITYISLSSSVLYLMLLLVFVNGKSDFYLVPLLNATISMVTFLFSIMLIKKKFKVFYKPPSFQEVKETFNNGCNAFISQFAPNLYNNATVFMLGFFANNVSVGLYTSATKIVDAILSFGYILSNAFFPYLSRNLRKHKFFQKLMIISGSVLTIFTFIFSEVITKFLFGSGNVEISPYLKFMSLSIILIFISITYGTNYLMLVGRDRIVKNISLVTSITFFVFSLFVIPIFGIWGGVATLIGARLVMAVFQYFYYLKVLRLEK